MLSCAFTLSLSPDPAQLCHLATQLLTFVQHKTKLSSTKKASSSPCCMLHCRTGRTKNYWGVGEGYLKGTSFPWSVLINVHLLKSCSFLFIHHVAVIGSLQYIVSRNTHVQLSCRDVQSMIRCVLRFKVLLDTDGVYMRFCETGSDSSI